MANEVRDWINANLPADERRLTGVYLNYFAAVPEVTVAATLTRLATGFVHPHRHPVLEWIPMISQMQRVGVAGAAFHAVLHGMTSGAGALTGQQLYQFWMTALGGRGRSEVLFGCINHLLAGGTPTQIRNCIVSFLDGAHRIALDKDDLLVALTHLKSSGLDDALALTFCNFMQTNLPAGQPPRVYGQSFLRLCHGMRNAVIPVGTFLNFLNVHPPLTDDQFARLLLDLGYRRFRSLIEAALPAGLNVPTGAPHTSPNMIGYAITREHIDAVSVTLSKCIEAEMIPVGTDVYPAATDLIFRLFEHLQHVAAGDRVKREGLFIEEASASRNAKGRVHPWSEVETLLENFRQDNRHGNNPAAIPPPAPVNVGRIRCTGERIRYFMRGHSYAYHDFTLAARTRHEITLFPLGTTVANVRTAVGGALAAVSAADVDEAVDGGKVHIVVVGGYELGLIADAGGARNAALIHFMPHAMGAASFWHTSLLRAFRHLYNN